MVLIFSPFQPWIIFSELHEKGSCEFNLISDYGFNHKWLWTNDIDEAFFSFEETSLT